jgi:energy-coupling factor transport system ATP-binding protein
MEISLQGLGFRYEGSPDWALNDINLEIDRGEFVLVAGEGGAGKSTLLYCLNGLIPHVINGTFQGSVQIEGNPLDRKAMDGISRRVGFIFQNSESQLFTTTVEEEVALGLEENGVPWPEMERKIMWALETAGLSSYRETPLYALSGGQKQILALVSILVTEPKILLLDEPTGDLDPIFSRKVYQLLRRINEAGTNVILVDHKIEAILEIIGPTFRVIALKGGKILVDGRARGILSDSELMKEIGLQVPAVVEMGLLLSQRGCLIDHPLTVSEGVASLDRWLGKSDD